MTPRPHRRRILGLLTAAIAALSLPGTPQAFAQELVLEVIQLKYRTADQVIPILQPLVPRPGTLSGMQSSLIVRTTRSNLADIQKVLASIDRAPRRLMITVRQDADRSSDGQGVAVSGSVGTGGARVTVPGSRDPRGLTVEGRQGDDRLRAQVYGTQSLENDRTAQQVQVLEGSEALIRVGVSVPVSSRSVARGYAGGLPVEQAVDTVEYRDVLTGFVVRPRVAGNVVTLDIAPQRDTLARGTGSFGVQRGGTVYGQAPAVDVQRVATTVSGTLGEWIEIGGVVSGRAIEETGTVYRTTQAGSDNRRVLIKVDELP